LLSGPLRCDTGYARPCAEISSGDDIDEVASIELEAARQQSKVYSMVRKIRDEHDTKEGKGKISVERPNLVYDPKRSLLDGPAKRANPRVGAAASSGTMTKTSTKTIWTTSTRLAFSSAAHA
jgi:hypothetical protein